MIEISKKLAEKILSSCKKDYFMGLAGEVIEEEKKSYYGNYKENKFILDKFICSCTNGYNVIQKVNTDIHPKCKFCGKTKGFIDFASSEIKNLLKSVNNYYYKNITSDKKKLEDFVYFQKHSSEENGIECYIGEIIVKKHVDKKGNLSLLKEIVIKYYFEFIPGKKIYSIKVLKRSNKEVTLFEAFNLNSQNITFRDCLYENDSDFFGFLEDNEEFMKRCGFIEALKGITDKYMPQAFFILHLALITTYPVLELLIKMKYFKLYFDIVSNSMKSESKENLLKNIEDLNKLFNNTTKGTMALKIPQYIGNYLKEKSAPLSEYIAWCDIYDIEQISKDNFEKLINSICFYNMSFSNSLSKLPNIMKYEYDLEKLLRYLHKISRVIGSSSSHYHQYEFNITLLQDYLQTCDLMGIEADKTPQDLNKIHNEIMKLYRSKENEIEDNKLFEISQAVTKCLERDIDDAKQTKMEKEYIIKIPDSTKDFLNEGTAQHNCVGTYVRNVLRSQCIIFFIRKKENPNESYITAEYRNGSLGQVMFKNNIRVEDPNILNYCKVICNKIKRNIINGTIPQS